MNDQIKTLGIIPARGGSKGVPRKNIRLLGGLPLVAYTIKKSQKVKNLTTFVVSTEDPEIAAICRKLDARVPFMRPTELATDRALAIPTMQHAVLETEKIDNIRYDIIVMLQPTCPFTKPSEIEMAIQKLINSNADSVISVADVGASHPNRMKKIENDRLIDYAPESIENMPRQELPPIYIKSGDIYAVKRDVLMLQNTFVGKDSRPIIIPSDHAINIDGWDDWILAEQYIKNNPQILSDA